MTWQGAVAVLYIASAAGEPMRAIGEATAVAGRGLAGDRYAEGAGVYSRFAGPLREVSLIEAEVLGSGATTTSTCRPARTGARSSPGACRWGT